MVDITKRTTIELKKETKNKLSRLGRKGQTFDQLVSDLLKHVGSCDRFWVNRF